MVLNMFRASLCSSSGGQLYITNWMHNFIYSIIILHHDPQHVSRIAVLIFRRTIVYHQLNAQFYLFNNTITLWFSTCFEHRCARLQEDNCIFTVSGIVTLYMLPYSAPIKSGQQSDLNRCTVWQHTEWDDTRYCKYTIVLLKMSTAMLETCWGTWRNIIIE
jgi:hypothetical protein